MDTIFSLKFLNVYPSIVELSIIAVLIQLLMYILVIVSKLDPCAKRYFKRDYTMDVPVILRLALNFLFNVEITNG